MKKVFIMTPMEINEVITSEVINTYIRKAAGAAKAIIDEDIEVETNFFLEPIGTDKDGEPIMQVRNSTDEIAYMAEELSLMEKCDYIVTPAYDDGIGTWSCSRALFRDFHIYRNEREIFALPIHLCNVNAENYRCDNRPVSIPRKSRYSY